VEPSVNLLRVLLLNELRYNYIMKSRFIKSILLAVSTLALVFAAFYLLFDWKIATAFVCGVLWADICWGLAYRKHLKASQCPFENL